MAAGSMCEGQEITDIQQAGSSTGSHHSTCGASVIESASSSVRDAVDMADTDYNKTASADLTHSMTVSSITSYVTDNSLQQSPRVTEASKSVFSTSYTTNRPISNQPTTVTLVAPSAFKPVDASCNVAAGTQMSFGITMGSSVSSVSPMLQAAPDLMVTSSPVYTTTQNASMLNPPTVAYLTAPGMVTPVLSPCPSPLPLNKSYHGPFASNSHSQIPSQSSGYLSMSGGLPASTHSAQNMFPYSTSVSPLPVMQPTGPPQQDVLLDEIGRLRDRIQTLEGENMSMSSKLHKQQYEVESRLSEIEMHICGSESGCSRESTGDDKSLHGNRESII